MSHLVVSNTANVKKIIIIKEQVGVCGTIKKVK